MGTGTKLLAGCGCLALAIAVALVAGVGLGLLWLKGKAEKLTASLESLSAVTDEIDAWEAKANAHPWAPRPDGVIPEPRLVTFLEVRRRVHAVHERNRAEIEALGRVEGPGAPHDPSRILAMGGRTAVMFTELHLAQVKALAELGMSEPEYRAIQLAVYKAAGAARGLRARCLRFAGRVTPPPRKTRSRLVASLYRVGTSTRGSASEGFSDGYVIRPPSPGFGLAQYAMHGLALLGL
jgi:hypothetical protein